MSLLLKHWFDYADSTLFCPAHCHGSRPWFHITSVRLWDEGATTISQELAQARRQARDLRRLYHRTENVFSCDRNLSHGVCPRVGYFGATVRLERRAGAGISRAHDQRLSAFQAHRRDDLLRHERSRVSSLRAVDR